MCVLAFAWASHPRWRLIAAGNRDEFHAREAAPLAEWTDLPGVIAGRDLRSGGTWMGAAHGGRVAVVTNFRGVAPDPGRPSRGDLVTGALAGADPAAIDAAAYNGFNLIAADAKCAYFVSNRPAPAHDRLAPGIYGVANGALDEPWPKTLAAKALVAGWLAGAADDPAAMLDGLRVETAGDPGLDSLFILNPAYGTRCSTVVAVDHAGAGVIVERRYDPAGMVTGETEIAIRATTSV